MTKWPNVIYRQVKMFPWMGVSKSMGRVTKKGLEPPLILTPRFDGFFATSFATSFTPYALLYFLHKEIFRTLRTTSTAGVNNFLWWIEWGLRNWPDQTKTKHTNQNTYKYMFKCVCVLKCVHQEDQPHWKNNVYIMYKKYCILFYNIL